MRIADCGTRKRTVNPVELKSRTKAFAIKIIKLADKLPDSMAANTIARQVVRSGMSVGANYRAKSRADFISKLGIVEEECDETIYWMELLVESGKVKMDSVNDLINEASQLLAIVVASINTARAKSNPQSAIRNPQSR